MKTMIGAGPVFRAPSSLWRGIGPIFVIALGLIAWGGCSPTEPNELDTLGKVTMTIKGRPFELWVADQSDEQLKGLMFVTAQQMAPLPNGTQRGMIFVFDSEQSNSFWMRNTIIPLDIAYVGADRRVVKTYTMSPLDERTNQYPPGALYRYAIEVNANQFSELGLRAGDVLEFPETLLKRPSQ